MRRIRMLLLAPPLALGLVASPAFSQWGVNGFRLCASGCAGDTPLLLPDGAGGAFIAWRTNSNQGDVYLQRVTALGNFAPGWPIEGLPVCTDPLSQQISAIAPDGLGGVLITWQDQRDVQTTLSDIYAHRIRGDGSLAPGWSVNGVPATRNVSSQSFPVIAPDGTGGAYLAWEDNRNYVTNKTDVYAQHLTADGTVTPGWPADGRPVAVLPQFQGFPNILSDGAGGAIVVWGDLRNARVDVYAVRLLADGTVAPGWVESGVLLLAGDYLRAVIADQAGGFFVAWATYSPQLGYDVEYWAQRFTFDGTVAAGWPAGGVRLCAVPNGLYGLEIASDGLGGLLSSWYDYRPPYGGGEIFAMRALANGTLAPGWTLNGLRVSDASGTGFEFHPVIAPDGTGGAYLVWQREYSGGRPSYVQHVTATGLVAAGWPPYGVRLAPAIDQFDSRITSDGQGGAIVAWDQQSPSAVYAQRFVMDGVVAVEVSLVGVVAEPERVRLAWQVAQAVSFRATVERRGATSPWQSLDDVSADGTGRIAYEDRSVTAGERYAYRLTYTDEGTERQTSETWVDVPAAWTLTLEGARPNPAVDALNVAFTLPREAPATLALLDVSGRQVASREVGSLGAGRHLVRLDQPGRTPPGVYWIRLTQSEHILAKRAVVVK